MTLDQGIATDEIDDVIATPDFDDVLGAEDFPEVPDEIPSREVHVNLCLHFLVDNPQSWQFIVMCER